MTNKQQAEERWKKVEQLFHEALELRPEERESFLSRSCEKDEELKQEVASLLANFSDEQSLLPGIDMEEARRVIAGAQPRFKAGDRLEDYEILSLLGKGGMGEVYLARDSKLQRKVAIKLLPELYSTDKGLLDRLQSEAQTASSLNHPNILTIYAFGETEGCPYIVSEYVEGIQLREKIGTLDEATAIQYAAQIARALEAAHSVGIVHRDIKPENIMIRPDGYLKVLDFGLAKYVGGLPEQRNSVHGRIHASLKVTTPGLILGTIGYMSPEQLRGKEVDACTDIWSWGVVFYEMLTGKRPFEAETPSDVMVKILDGNPVPPSNDKRINSILSCALAKESTERYQNIRQALEDLGRLQPALLRSKSWSPSGPQRQVPGTWAKPSKKLLLGQWLLWTAIVILLTLSGVGVFRLYEQMRGTPYHVESITRLTTIGAVSSVTITSDGNYAAYAAGDTEKQSLHILQVGTNADTERIPATPGAQYIGLTFSPDGNFLYYVLQRAGVGTLYRIPMLAGQPETILTDIDSPICFSPDGKEFAFERFAPLEKKDRVFIHKVKENEDLQVALITAPSTLYSPPSFTPDGRSLVFAIYDGSVQSGNKARFASVNIRSKKLELGQIVTIGTGTIGRPVALSPSRVLVPLSDEKLVQRHIYDLNWKTGEMSQLTHGSWFDGIATTTDFKTIIASQRDRVSDIWLAPLREGQQSKKLTPSSGRFFYLIWTDENTVITQTESNGITNLWQIHVDSDLIHSITAGSGKDSPPLTNPHSSYLVFSSTRDGTYHLWRSKRDGSEAKRITSDEALEMTPVLSPDGKNVFYISGKDGQMSLWRVALAGGDPQRVTNVLSRNPDISPDGKWIVCEYAKKSEDRWMIAVINVNTGKIAATFPQIPTNRPVRWSADGTSLLYASDHAGVSNIWQQPVHGGSARQLTHFEEERIFAFAPSPDGRSIACIRGNTAIDAVLIRGSR